MSKDLGFHQLTLLFEQRTELVDSAQSMKSSGFPIIILERNLMASLLTLKAFGAVIIVNLQ